MITEKTPYKLAEVIRDTWPNLYHLKRSQGKTNLKEIADTNEHPRRL